MTDLLQREGRVRQDATDSTNLPVRGLVSAVNSEKESVTVDLSLTSGGDNIQIRHPFAGMNAWIRAMPDVGTELFIQQRGDSVGNLIIGYALNDAPKRITDANNSLALYRVLNPGELELMSAGRAYMFLGDYGDIELRGGTIRCELLQSDLEFTSTAPTYRRRLHLNANPALAHEERFGVVKRPDTTNKNTVSNFVKLADGSFAVERSHWLNTKSGKLLSSAQAGNVTGVDGKPVKQSSTNKDLRYQFTLGHTNGNDTIDLQVDEELNLVYDNGATNAKETIFRFGLNNTLDINADALKLTMTKTGTMTFNTSLSVTSNIINMKGAQVNIGNSPTFPALLGSTLVTSLMVPMVTAMQTFFQLYGADPAIVLMSPQTVAAANALAAVLAQAQATLPNTLSSTVMVSG